MQKAALTLHEHCVAVTAFSGTCRMVQTAESIVL